MAERPQLILPNLLLSGKDKAVVLFEICSLKLSSIAPFAATRWTNRLALCVLALHPAVLWHWGPRGNSASLKITSDLKGEIQKNRERQQETVRGDYEREKYWGVRIWAVGIAQVEEVGMEGGAEEVPSIYFPRAL